jgi:protein tyrosine/serine phosphatase
MKWAGNTAEICELNMAFSSKSKRRWLIGLALFLAFAGYIYRTSVFRISKNFVEVDPGKFYRSAQLAPDELAEVIDKYGIKTVISLRGAPENSYWVPDQIRILKEKNVQFLPLSWTSHFFPEDEEFRKYILALKTAERPILVHCRTGADRTGEASAIYAMEFMGVPKAQAIAEQLSFKNYHVRFLHPAKAHLVEIYQGMDWALSSYHRCSPENKAWAEPGHCPP